MLIIFGLNYIPDSATLSKICLISSSIIKATTKPEAGCSRIGGFVDLDFLFWISDSVSRIGFDSLGTGGSIEGFVGSSFGLLDSDSVCDVFFVAGKKY